MDVGIHVPIFDIDGGTTAIAGELARLGAAVEACRRELAVVHGPLLPDRADRAARRGEHAGGLHDARLPGRAHLDDQPRPAGHRRDLPPPRNPGQDRHHARRAVGRSRRARHRRRMVRTRAPRARRALPTAGRTVRTPRRGAADLQPDVGPGQQRPVRRQALPTRGDVVFSATDQPTEGDDRR